MMSVLLASALFLFSYVNVSATELLDEAEALHVPGVNASSDAQKTVKK